MASSPIVDLFLPYVWGAYSGRYEILSSYQMKVRVSSATRIQAQYKSFVQRRIFLLYRQTVIFLQSHVRMFLAKLALRRLREEHAACLLQRFARMCLQKRKYLRVVQSATCIQAAWRGREARKKCKDLRIQNAASLIAASWKMMKQRKFYLRLKKAVTMAQLRLVEDRGTGAEENDSAKRTEGRGE